MAGRWRGGDASAAAVAAIAALAASSAAFAQGVAGSDRAAQFLRGALSGASNVDILVVGDSNAAFGGSGWVHGFAYGCWRLAPQRMYATPVLPFTDGPTIGFRCRAASGLIGRTSSNGNGLLCHSGGGSEAGQPLPLQESFGVGEGSLRITGVPLDWAWLPYADGQPYLNNLSSWYLEGGAKPCPIGLRHHALVHRVVHGASALADEGAGFHVGWRQSDRSSVVFVSTRERARGVAAWHWTATETPCPPEVNQSNAELLQATCAGFGGPQQMYGEMALALHSVFRRDRGWSVSPLSYHGGGTMTDLRDDVAGVATPNRTLATLLREYRGRQRSAGGPGRVIVWIQGGGNLFDWWDGPSKHDAEMWGRRVEEIWDTIRGEWVRMGLPEEDLACVAMVSHPSNQWDHPLWRLRRVAAALPGRRPDLTIVEIADLFTYGELVGPPALLDPAGPAHLTRLGYERIGHRLIEALAASGCVADLDGSGEVGGGDLAMVMASWGDAPAGTAADLDRDGRVDAADLGEVLASWGPCR
jgi:hypothetical protein